MSDWTYTQPQKVKDVKINIGVCLDDKMRAYEYVVIATQHWNGIGGNHKFGYGHTPEEATEAAHKVTA